MPKTMSTAWFLRSTGTIAMSEDMGEDFQKLRPLDSGLRTGELRGPVR